MTDTFGREITYLRLSVTDLCNLRCRYCMPAEGVCRLRHEDMLTEEETVDAVRAAAELGIRKVRVTGGEPLVKKNILSLCENIARVPGIEEVCLTTNGTLLPALAKKLRAAGVSRVNISLDTLDAGKYRQMTRGGDVSEAKKGLQAALSAGFEKVKVNAVLIGGFNDDEIRGLAELTLKEDLDVRFIELMPMLKDSGFPEVAYLPGRVVSEALPEAVPAGKDGVAELWRLPGAKGCVGLIRPLSCSFCSECTRLRLTADGRVRPCLHSSLEFGIKGLSKDGMKEVMRQAILAKPKDHGKLSPADVSPAGRTMERIGG